jgi:predicted PurR-regulated permease PerM
VLAGGMVFFTMLTNMRGVMEVARRIVSLFTPVIYGFIFAYLLTPIMNYFDRKCFRVLLNKAEKRRNAKGKTRTEEEAALHKVKVKRISRNLSTLTTIIVALLCLVGLVSAILPEIMDSVRTLIDRTPVYIRNIQNWDLAFLNGFPEMQENVRSTLQELPARLNSWLQEDVMVWLGEMAGPLTSGIWTAIGSLINILLGLIICVYLLHGKELFAAQGKKSLYAIFSVGGANLIINNLREMHKKFGGFLTGKIIESLVIGALCFIIFTIMDMPYITLISVIIGVTNIIPFFGPIIGAIPCSLLIVVEDPIKCLYFIIIILIIQQVDGNLIGPKILGDNTGLSSFWVIFAIVVGQRMFGFIGLVVGVPVFAFIYAVVKARITGKLEKKSLPADSNYYRNVSHIEKETGEFVFFDESAKPKVKKEKKRRRFIGKDS